MPKSATVVPSARRLIGSLRDLGYETREAVADLVDNSIAAGARNVDITISFDGNRSWIRIADDGHGMTATEITEAMRYGASRRYADDDLGKFGLGLKTASMSQCRCLSVASRTSKSVARVEARKLDLGYVERHDTWDVLILGKKDRPNHLVAPLRDRRGTVVLWEDLDRILVYKDPHGGWAARRLKALAEDLELHLGMVFHRFIMGEAHGRRLRITINENLIDPWDPFDRDEDATRPLPAGDFPLSTVSGSGMVRLDPFILPPKALYGSTHAWRRASGPRNWNSQQGFYIYRANRLIQSGGWSGMRTADEHTKLARIALSFGPELDDAFDVNVAKMRVKLPPELRELIEEAVADTARAARGVYDAKPDGGTRRTRGSAPSRDGANRAAAASRGSDSDPTSTDAPTGGSTGIRPAPAAHTNDGQSMAGGETTAVVSLREALEAAARDAGETDALHRIIQKLHANAPGVARELGW